MTTLFKGSITKINQSDCSVGESTIPNDPAGPPWNVVLLFHSLLF